jgi:hypothetical protein
MLAIFASACLTIIASLALGAGILAVCRVSAPLRLAPGVGFAALIALATMCVRAPGRAVTGLILVALASVVGGWRARQSRAPAGAVAGAAVATVAVLGLLSLPFVAAGRFGPLGASIDYDLGLHVHWVDALANGPPPWRFFSLSYPLGGESLAACLTRLGIGEQQALIGVAAAALGLSAITAFGALERVRLPLRVVLAVACGVPFLSAAFFGEGSFKEPTIGLLVLTTALLVLSGEPLRRILPGLVVLAAGALFVFGPPAVGWPFVCVALRIFAERWRRPQSRRLALRQLGMLVAGLAAVALAAVAVAAISKQIGAGGFSIDLSGPTTGKFGGNFARQLPLTEALGVWFGHDFRLSAGSGPLWLLALVVAIGVCAAAVVAELRRWRSSLLLPVVAALLVYLAARLTTLAYFSAKLLVAAGPLLVLFAVFGVLALREARPRWRAVVPVGLAGAFAAAVIWSSAGALWNSPVDDSAFGAELATLQPIVKGHVVLFLGYDFWSVVSLKDTTLFADAATGHPLRAQSRKSASPPFDFDSPLPAELDAAEYVITTRTLDASSPPRGWALVRTTAHFQLFARRGRSETRKVLPEEESAPGAVLDCTSGARLRLNLKAGIAAVRTAPVASSTWQGVAGSVAVSPSGTAFIGAGRSAAATIRLPPGRFELSLSYESAVPMTLSAAGSSFRLTPTLEPLGPLWRAGVITSSGGPTPLRITVANGHLPIPTTAGLAEPVFAVPTDEHDTIVPLRKACGRYVDWYQPHG